MAVKLILGDCLVRLKDFDDCSIDAIVTDPPYGLSFMGKRWDYDVPSVEIWKQCMRVLKPGGHLLAFAGTRTQHRMAVRIEDAGFEIRDMIAWVYGSGFPKSMDVSKAIDKAADATRETGPIGPVRDPASQWQGWGTALKPALEPITVARKPLIGTVTKNVLTHGTGGVNIDACRVEGRERTDYGLANSTRSAGNTYGKPSASADFDSSKGRWPANLIHDGSDEVTGLFPETGGGSYSKSGSRNLDGPSISFGTFNQAVKNAPDNYAHTGSAARFFYCAKASKKDRGENNNHPTVKPTVLMQYLCRLVTPPNGTVLDPFMGSGTTAVAAKREKFNFIGIEMLREHFETSKRRVQKEKTKP